MFKKKFERILLKNTMAIVVPAVAVLFVLSFLLTRFSVFAQIKNINLDAYSDFEVGVKGLYENNTTNVTATISDLYYTGFDYIVNGEVKGGYYYSLSKEKMCFYLLSTDSPEEYIERVSIKGKIIKDSVTLNHIIQRLSADNKIDNDYLKGYCFEYIISEPDYPESYIVMLKVFFVVPIILEVLIILYALLIWFEPKLHPQCKQLAQYGQIDAIIDELNSQLRNQLLFRKNKIYITRDYMIVNYIHRTDVIKLDYIKYLSKNLVEKKEFLSGTDEVYRLTMSDPDKIFYEVDFLSEELIDDVIGYIRGVNKKEKSLDT